MNRASAYEPLLSRTSSDASFSDAVSQPSSPSHARSAELDLEQGRVPNVVAPPVAPGSPRPPAPAEAAPDATGGQPRRARRWPAFLLGSAAGGLAGAITGATGIEANAATTAALSTGWRAAVHAAAVAGTGSGTALRSAGRSIAHVAAKGWSGSVWITGAADKVADLSVARYRIQVDGIPAMYEAALLHRRPGQAYPTECGGAQPPPSCPDIYGYELASRAAPWCYAASEVVFMGLVTGTTLALLWPHLHKQIAKIKVEDLPTSCADAVKWVCKSIVSAAQREGAESPRG